ncbi:hexuronate transporter [Brevibacterium sediminis]|uniref:Hexuronate transporter n=1 Tax=Brevibacterium sediminis TaxID=1857024 RepID=A0ABQ1M8R5_9MICO|nr:MFS transporter [Brevibacterium sediminis]GGC36754.1 hexuronate transporter [Brevibacterium sediminis]
MRTFLRTNYRWVIVGLLLLVGILNYLDRSALSVAAPYVKEDLGLDDTEFGIIQSSFFFGYVIMCFLGGWAADKMGPRKVFAWAAAAWAVFCGLTAAAFTFVHLLVLRVLFGIAEGPMGTTMNKSIANWFPKHEVGRAVGAASAGQPLGAAVATPVVGLIALSIGWRESFVFISLLTLAWVVLWVVVFRNRPSQHPRVSSEELTVIDRGQQANALTEDESSHGVFHYVFSWPVLGVAAGFFCFNYIQFFFLTWLPSYLVEGRGLSVHDMSFVGMLPWLGATVGFLLGGTVSDILFKRTGRLLFARKTTIVIGLGVAGVCVLLSAFATSTALAVMWITIAAVFAYFTPQNCFAMVQDTVPADRVGAAGGFVHLLANLAGIFAPALTGIFVQHLGGYTTAFAVAGVSALVGVLMVLGLVRPKTVAKVAV